MTQRRDFMFAAVVCIPVVALYSAFYLIPIGTTIVTSLLKWDRIHIEGFIGLENYIRLAQDPIFFISLKNISIWLLIAVFVHIPFALIVAIMLSTKPKGWKVLRTIYFVPQIISGVAWATIFISVYNPSYGLLNGLLKLVGLSSWARNWLFDAATAWPSIIGTWLFFIGMFSMILLAELLSIPEEIYEAAAIDGASEIQAALYVKLPMLRLVTGTCLILTISGGIKYFDGLYIMTNGAPNFRTQTLALYLHQQYSYARYSYANTIGVALLLLGIVCILAVMKVMRTGEKDY